MFLSLVPFHFLYALSYTCDNSTYRSPFFLSSVAYLHFQKNSCGNLSFIPSHCFSSIQVSTNPIKSSSFEKYQNCLSLSCLFLFYILFISQFHVLPLSACLVPQARRGRLLLLFVVVLSLSLLAL